MTKLPNPDDRQQGSRHLSTGTRRPLSRHAPRIGVAEEGVFMIPAAACLAKAGGSGHHLGIYIAPI